MVETSGGAPRPVASRGQRWLLASLGIVCVGLGAVGVVVPGLPTTVFLIVASWCFARSCPWLEERLIRVPLFRPFLGYLEPGRTMPRRAVVTTLAIMWFAILASAGVLALGNPGRVGSAAVVLGLGLVGTPFVVRLGNPHSGESALSMKPRRHSSVAAIISGSSSARSRRSAESSTTS